MLSNGICRLSPAGVLCVADGCQPDDGGDEDYNYGVHSKPGKNTEQNEKPNELLTNSSQQRSTISISRAFTRHLYVACSQFNLCSCRDVYHFLFRFSI